MLIFRGREEAGPAVVFAAIAVVVGGWVWRRESRAAMIASLVLGLLWLVQFAAYTVADVRSDEAETAIFVTDVIAVVGGVLLVAGAVQALRRKRLSSPNG